MNSDSSVEINTDISDLLTRSQLLQDYATVYKSRQISLLGRREVLSGRAKFGAFGAGKEVAQIALAHAFRPGDFRSGYYRDQTWMLALDMVTTQTLFAQLYAHTDVQAEPASGGRMMVSHFATRSLNPDGSWRNLTEQHNSSADISPTGGQMPRLVGLAQASKIYREVDDLHEMTQFSRQGQEVAFGSIGNASAAEGVFWESLNAIGVLQVPAVISIWDDGYGISVSNKDQILKENHAKLLAGFQRTETEPGFDIYSVRGWDYAQLAAVYKQAAERARTDFIPAIIHVTEVTQPQGHSTSGSHQRYKSAERLQWETDFDCVTKMRNWLIDKHDILATELDALEKSLVREVRHEQRLAWDAFIGSAGVERDEVVELIDLLATEEPKLANQLETIKKSMFAGLYPKRRDILAGIFSTLKLSRHSQAPAKQEIIKWRDLHKPFFQSKYSQNLDRFTEEEQAATSATRGIAPSFAANAPELSGFELLNRYFDSLLARDPRVLVFGEDVGYLGGVNQALAGLQTKYGRQRVADTGIREATIMGQAIGMALRGLRPIAEIQYLDYLLYALQIMSDDLATTLWRTNGGQKAPVIVRTRGHRLEGVWHSGSPMGTIIHALRGMHVLVPRDMTRAAGFYNTLMQGDDPGLVVEPLNGYRQKEQLPTNLDDFRIPLGTPETLRAGRDATLITYGSLCPIVLDAARELAEVGVEVEVIDVQSLLPFDTNHQIVNSLKRTNRLVVIDEDVPGGASAFMLQQVLEAQGGYQWLDSQPITIAAQAHRPAYGSDGDYFSKPNEQDIFKAVYELMHDARPRRYPLFYEANQPHTSYARSSDYQTNSIYTQR